VKEKPTTSTQRLLPLAPKIGHFPTKGSPLASNPTQPLFSNDEEFSYFKVFAATTSHNLGEYLDITIWNYIVLQASEQENFIKHAIIALGALDKSHDSATLADDFSGKALISGSPHYQVAFRHYGKSIQGIRRACQEQRKSRRTILIACLLAVCFEYYHGNIDLAIAHSQNGINLSKYLSPTLLLCA
jgi:Fungal specific transcription factor domain